MQTQENPRLISLVPNMLTCLNLILGFTAVTYCVQGRFAMTYWMLLLAGVCDGFDGRIARSTGSTSEFGAQLDSLADIVSFGFAPAMLIWQWCYTSLGPVAHIAAFAYLCATALRLARFNAQDRQEKTQDHFNGLPCPAAALGCIMLPWMLAQLGFANAAWGHWLLWGWGLVLAGAQISQIPYPSGKNLTVPRNKIMLLLWGVGVIVSMILINPAIILTPLGVAYIVIPPILQRLKG